MKKSKFNLSYDNSLTLDMGKLVPFYIQDCIPGDSYRLRLQSFIRAQPMLAPLMHRVNFYTQYWFVPYRILWDNWTDFITGGLSGNSTPTFPTMKVKSETSSLADYFGIPLTKGENTLEVSALPFRAYAEIWNTRYRDEDLQGEVAISYADGLDTTTQTKLLQPSWRKDYFTTARPFTQRGSQISVPVSPSAIQGSAYPVYSPVITFSKEVLTTAPTTKKLGVIRLSNYSQGLLIKPPRIDFQFSGAVSNYSLVSDISTADVQGYFEFRCARTVRPTSGWNPPAQVLCSAEYVFYVSCTISYGSVVSYSDSPVSNLSGLNFSQFEMSYLNGENANANCPTAQTAFKISSNVVTGYISTSAKVDLANSGSVNIRDLRLSSALQRYQERSLEYGNRYEEFIQREFGVKPRDSRIQRPEYLGGSESVLQISEVLQTAEGTDTGVGTMRGHGVTALRSRGIRFRCPEHGIIIGLLSIRPRAVYTQGLERFWRKFSKLDYYVPELANIGMQEVFETELFADGETANYDKVFGYAPRYAEYRSRPNKVCGEFRNVLDFWNLARVFDNAPALNGDFLTMNPSKRVFAEQTQNSFLCMVYNDAKAWRPIPKRAKNILQ
nr:major head protein [Microvirus sp.]